MNLYVMRHGRTVWNELGITQGWSRNRLSLTGKMQTEKVAKKYSKVLFDVIVVSPLMRTVQTANIVNKYHNVKVIKDEEIIEIKQGIFTGRKKDSLTLEEQDIKRKRLASANMESFENCFERCKKFVKTLETKYNYENVLVVTHDTNATFIESIVLGKDVDFKDRKCIRNFKNSEIKKFVLN